jgi:hypothetical protein
MREYQYRGHEGVLRDNPYLQLTDGQFKTVIDEAVEENLSWQGVDRDGQTVTRRARLPRVIFVRNGKPA